MRCCGKGPRISRLNWRNPVTKRIIKAGLCLMRGGKVLLARSEGGPHFQIPGGKIEPGETDVQALVRETREELALSLDPEEVSYLGTFTAPAAGRTSGAHFHRRAGARGRRFRGDPRRCDPAG